MSRKHIEEKDVSHAIDNYHLKRENEFKAYQFGQSWIFNDILQSLSMSCTNEHNSSLSNCTACMNFSFCANLINNYHLRHMILNGFYHDLMLQGWIFNLQSSCTPYCWMWNIPLTSYFIAGVNNNLSQYLKKESGNPTNGQ